VLTDADGPQTNGGPHNIGRTHTIDG